MNHKKVNEIEITPSARIHDILLPLQILGGANENILVRRSALMENIKIRALYDVICTLVVEKTQDLSVCNLKDEQRLNKVTTEYRDAMDQLMMLMDRSMGPDVIRRIEAKYPQDENKKNIDAE